MTKERERDLTLTQQLAKFKGKDAKLVFIESKIVGNTGKNYTIESTPLIIDLIKHKILINKGKHPGAHIEASLEEAKRVQERLKQLRADSKKSAYSKHREIVSLKEVREYLAIDIGSLRKKISKNSPRVKLLDQKLVEKLNLIPRK
jgi:hypothetical protein